MKLTSILGALSAAFAHAPTTGIHYLNPQPLPPG